MSEFTAVGPALDLDGPRPRRPRHSLLETEGVVVTEGASRELNGVNVYGYPTGCPWLWEPCSDGTFRTKPDESEQLLPRFDSFVVGTTITCSAIGMGDPSVFSARTNTALEATLSSGVEKMLAEGLVQSSNPFFGDANVDVLASGSAVSPGVALSYLEEAIGTTCREGLIHATPAVIAALQAFPIGGQNERLETANGTPVVSGMGYQDVDTPWLAEPDDTEDWIFATGPVNVYLGPIVTGNIRDSLERSLNDVTFRAERYVVAVWDTALQAAVLVDWST
jgi:hypothetical protein